MQLVYVIKELEISNITDDLLITFDRYQKTTEVLILEDGQFIKKYESYIDEWDENRKSEIIKYLRECVYRGGNVAGVFIEGQLKGFTNLESDLFGVEDNYCEMPFFHISADYRGMGFGKILFRYMVEIARNRSIHKIYLATNPNLSTQMFYKNMGCVPSVEINSDILAREPLDNQLEFVIH